MKGPYVTKEFTFDAAHMLTGHEGLCKNLHGHTYKVLVTIGQDDICPGESTPANEGMIIDFKDLSAVVDKALISQVDHAFIYNSKGGSAERQIAELLQSFGMRTYDMGIRPTAEHMAWHFGVKIKEALFAFDTYLYLVKVQVYETPKAFAEVLF